MIDVSAEDVRLRLRPISKSPQSYAYKTMNIKRERRRRSKGRRDNNQNNNKNNKNNNKVIQ